jgi:hypothetical protein
LSDIDEINKLSGIIPELWHDIIARIVPGLLILFLTYPDTDIFLKDISFGALPVL